MSDKIALRFGELEAVLADLNGIPSYQRTAFQARLKNFHRLGFPEGIGQGRGKAVIYGARELVLMAVAIELTQLGLTPERVIGVITDDEYPVWMCTSMAASSLKARPEVFNPGPGDVGNPPDQKVWGFSPKWADSESTDPFSMFLYCDPAALAPWTEEDEDRASATFFFGGIGVIRENLSRWTTGPTRRLALINVTGLLFDMAAYLAGERGLELIDEFQAVADAFTTRGDFDLDEWLATTAKRLMMIVAAGPEFLVNHATFKASWTPLKDLFADLPEDHVFRRITRRVDQQKQEKPWMSDRTAPDMIIRLPGQRQLMVDAKVTPLADIPQEGIYSRIQELVEQPYRSQFTDRTEYIVLYVPSEHFFSQAMAAERGLYEEALAQKIIIASPSVLLKLLDLADKAWEKYCEEFPDLGKEEFEGLSEEYYFQFDPDHKPKAILPPRIGAKPEDQSKAKADNGDDQEA